MSTRPDVLEQALAGDIFEMDAVEPQISAARESIAWNPDRFGEEQIRSLVRQVFLPGWPKPARQVVFCAVDDGDVDGIGLRVSQVLAAQIPGSVALVEAHLESPEVCDEYGSPTPISRPSGFRPLRDSARRVSSHLWRVPREMFMGENEAGLSVEWLPARLRELRLEFDYTIVHGPPAALCSDAALLGYLSDGVVLVLEANATRRAAAQRAVQMLHATNARLLGTVLSKRKFPIPKGIYRRL
jgi:succinoglycan biosynthesis transport protein ExoP